MNRVLQIVIFLGLIVFSPLFAEESDISLVANVDKAKASTDETITFTIKLRTPKSNKDLLIPEVGHLIQGMRILDFGSSTKEMGVEDEETKWYKLQADVSGSYILPAVKIKGPDGKSIETAEIFVELTAPDSDSNKGELQDDILDIKDIQRVETNFLLLAGYALIALLPILILGIFIYRRYRKSGQILIPVDPYTEVIKAINRFQTLDTKSDRKVIKEAFFDLSHEVRLYVERIAQYPATDRTTEEIRRDINEVLSLVENARQHFLDLLLFCDKIKFTDHSVSDESFRNCLEQAKQLAEILKPKKEDDSEEVI